MNKYLSFTDPLTHCTWEVPIKQIAAIMHTRVTMDLHSQGQPIDHDLIKAGVTALMQVDSAVIDLAQTMTWQEIGAYGRLVAWTGPPPRLDAPETVWTSYDEPAKVEIPAANAPGLPLDMFMGVLEQSEDNLLATLMSHPEDTQHAMAMVLIRGTIEEVNGYLGAVNQFTEHLNKPKEPERVRRPFNH